MAGNKQGILSGTPAGQGNAVPCLSGCRTSRTAAGFTLLELVTVLAISAILISLAVPSLSRMLQSNTRSSAVNTFLADMGYARSESIRLGGGITMCRSDSPEDVAATCSITSAHSGSGWASGWIVFHDLDANGFRETADPVLRVQAPIVAMDSILEGGNGPPSIFRFTGTGRLFNLAAATSLTFGGGSYDIDVRRILCVSFGGRARIAGDGSARCDSDNL